MRDEKLFAYSLSHDEDVWRWSVYDEDGVTVAGGSHDTQDAAQAAVNSTLLSNGGDALSA